MYSHSNSRLALSGKEATEVRIYQNNPSGARTEEEGTPNHQEHHISLGKGIKVLCLTTHYASLFLSSGGCLKFQPQDPEGH